MLKIKSNRTERELVQELAAEYINSKFYELKGDYDALMARVDSLVPMVSNLQQQRVSADQLHEDYRRDIEREVGKEVDGVKKAIFEEVGELRHRLEDVETHLGL